MALLTIVAANLGISPRDANLRLFSRQAGGAGSLPIRFDAGSPNPIYAGASSVEITLDLEGEWTADLPASNTYDVPQEYVLYNGATLFGYISLPEEGISPLQFQQLRRTTRPVSVPALLSAVEPVDPAEGEWWFNTTSNVLSVRHGGAWVTATSVGTGGTTVVYRAQYDIAPATGRTFQAPRDTLGRSAINNFTGSPGQTQTEHQPNLGIHVTEGGIYTADLYLSLRAETTGVGGGWDVRLLRTNGQSGVNEIIHDVSTDTFYNQDARGPTGVRKRLEQHLVMSRFNEGDYVFAEIGFEQGDSSSVTKSYDILEGRIIIRRYEGEQGVASRGVTIEQVNERIAAVVNPHALEGNFIGYEDLQEILRNDIRNSIDINGVSLSGREINFVSNDARTNIPINVPGVLLYEEDNYVDVGPQGASQIHFRGSSVTASRRTAGVVDVTVTGGTGQGSGPTNDDITALINQNEGVVRSGEFEAAMRYKRDLIRGVPVTQGLSNAAGRITGGPLVGPREEDMFLEVTVAGDAVHRFLQTDLLDLSTVNDSDQLTSSNSITWTGNNSSVEYHIAHASNGEILFAAADIGSYNLTIVADHIDLEGFARRSQGSTLVPAGKLGTGASGAGRVLHGDGTWQDAGGIPLPWAEEGGTGLVPTANLGSGTADETKILYGDQTWKDAPSGGAGNVADWAEDGNTDLVPVAKLPVASGTTSGIIGSAEFVRIGDSIDAAHLHDTPPLLNSFIEGADAVLIDDASVSTGSQLREIPFSELDKRWNDFQLTPQEDAALSIFTGTTGWTASTTITVSMDQQTTKPTASDVMGKTYVAAQVVGPRQTNAWIAARVPVANVNVIDDDRVRLRLFESSGTVDAPEADSWELITSNASYRWYVRQFADIPADSQYRVEEHDDVSLIANRIDQQEWRRIIVGHMGTHFIQQSPGVSPVSTSSNQLVASATALQWVNNAGTTVGFDLDDADKQHGEFHVSLDLHMTQAHSTVSFTMNQPSPGDEDRNINLSTIVFASDLRDEGDFTTSNLEGLVLFNVPVYAAATVQGRYFLLLVHDANNAVALYRHWQGAAGANAMTISAECRVTFTPTDTPAQSQAPAGLDQAAVDARVRALVENFAEVGDNTQIPDSKIPSTIARDSEIPSNSAIDGRARALIADWAEQGNASDIPDSKIPSSIARDSEVPSNSAIDARANARVNALVENFAKQGNNTRVQTAKLGSGTADATKVLYGDATWKDAPAGTTTFTGLTDTPSTLTGEGGKFVAVNSGATALELVDEPSGTANTIVASRQKAVGLGTNQKTVTQNTSAVVYSDWAAVNLTTDATTAGGFTVASNEMVFAAAEDINIEGGFVLQCNDSGGGARLYADVRARVTSSAGTVTRPDYTKAGNYNKTAADGTVAQGPDEMTIGFNFTLKVNAGDKVALEWRAWMQTNTTVDIVAADSALQVFVGARGRVGSFTGFTDTPENYTGDGGKFLAVNSGATAVEFVDAPGGVSDEQAAQIEDGVEFQKALRKVGDYLDDASDGDDINNSAISFTTANAATGLLLQAVPDINLPSGYKFQVKFGTGDWLDFYVSEVIALAGVTTGTVLTDSNSIALTSSGTIYRISKRPSTNEFYFSSSIVQNTTISIRKYPIEIDGALVGTNGLRYTVMTQSQYDAATKNSGQLYLISG